MWVAAAAAGLFCFWRRCKWAALLSVTRALQLARQKVGRPTFPISCEKCVRFRAKNASDFVRKIVSEMSRFGPMELMTAAAARAEGLFAKICTPPSPW